MMRAALILIGGGSLIAMELATPPRVAKAVHQPLAQSTVGVNYSRDTLSKADRLEIPYFQNGLSTRPMDFAERMPPTDSASIISRETTRAISENQHDAKAKKVALIRPRPRSKTSIEARTKSADSKTVANTSGAKATMGVKPCQPNALDSFLKALKLPTGCEA